MPVASVAPFRARESLKKEPSTFLLTPGEPQRGEGKGAIS
jgi:hypothetical protein